MKILISLSLIFSMSLFAKNNEAKKSDVKKETKTASKVNESKGAEAPCDTKEDVLKKIEEEKKKMKAFSLQGGDTGCTVK